MLGKFSWQTGYGAFSVSESNVGAVADYIREQEEHHRVKTFHEEFREFISKNKIDYDERYVWDCSGGEPGRDSFAPSGLGVFLVPSFPWRCPRLRYQCPFGAHKILAQVEAPHQTHSSAPKVHSTAAQGSALGVKSHKFIQP
jgi:hypothetical protein